MIGCEYVGSSQRCGRRYIGQIGQTISKRVQRHNSRCGILLPESITDYEFNHSSKKEKNDQKYWIEYLKSLDDYIKTNHPKVTSRTLVFNSLDMEKNLLTGTGSTSFSMVKNGPRGPTPKSTNPPQT